MMEDREILRETWEGRIPVCFLLASEEVYTVEQPDPFFLLVPRLSYFPLVTDKVQRHMVKHVDPEDQGEMWLEADGQPLKWHYPIGVLFDLFGSGEKLPWTVTVRFKNFPEDELLHCASKEAVESHFLSTLKEADAMKHRGQVINSMQKKDHKTLWTGFMNDKFDQFWSVNKRLMENAVEEPFKFIPFRVYQADDVPIQKLIKPVDSSGNPTTLTSLLKLAKTDFFNEDDVPCHRVLVQGVEPPLDTPLLWMSEHLSHPDNFLHVCLTPSMPIES